jgi:hypothetical protein
MDINELNIDNPDRSADSNSALIYRGGPLRDAYLSYRYGLDSARVFPLVTA